MRSVETQLLDREVALEMEPQSHWDEVERVNVLGRCVYDGERDPAHDECVFCGFPEERK